jgi:hypothetical protein
VILQHPVLVPKGSSDLGCQLIMQGIDQAANVIADVASVQVRVPLVPWVQDVFEIQQDVNDRGVARQWAVPQMIDGIIGGVRADDLLGQLW